MATPWRRLSCPAEPQWACRFARRRRSTKSAQRRDSTASVYRAAGKRGKIESVSIVSPWQAGELDRQAKRFSSGSSSASGCWTDFPTALGTRLRPSSSRDIVDGKLALGRFGGMTGRKGSKSGWIEKWLARFPKSGWHVSRLVQRRAAEKPHGREFSDGLAHGATEARRGTRTKFGR